MAKLTKTTKATATTNTGVRLTDVMVDDFATTCCWLITMETSSLYVQDQLSGDIKLKNEGNGSNDIEMTILLTHVSTTQRSRGELSNWERIKQ